MSPQGWIRPATAAEKLESGRAEFPGMELWWHEAHDGWKAGAAAGRRCRYGAGPGHPACGKPAVATLNRGRPWAYCAEHLYGRKLEDGRVIELRLRDASRPNAGRLP
jgi:hypothetical protein